MSAPILFLDFDGVLHPASAYQTNAFCCAPALADCLRPYPCDVVISSSWRFSYGLAELLDMLPSSLVQRVIGTTGPAHVGRYSRYQEIQKFLQDIKGLPEKSWRALDDATWEFPPAFTNLIACDANIGLQEKQLQQINRWLKRPN